MPGEDFNTDASSRLLKRLRHSLQAANQQICEQSTAHIRDSNQWSQTEKKLRSYLQLLDTLINTIPNPIFFKDADGVYQGCNNVFAKQILGLTRDLIIGKRPQELTDQIPPDLAAVYQREEIKMVHKTGFHTFETEVQCADGKRREFLFSLAPVIDEEGQINGSVAVLADLTEKNSALRDRMQKEKLEGVLETAGAVCHELNQPLQSLSGYAELVAMKAGEDDTFPLCPPNYFPGRSHARHHPEAATHHPLRNHGLRRPHQDYRYPQGICPRLTPGGVLLGYNPALTNPAT